MTHVVPDAEVESTARELALSLARGPSVALGYIKKNIKNAESATLDSCLDSEAVYHCRCLQTTDHKEATVAFLQKRVPSFVGK
jgi:2-(1,2-epoxy-1,2-dihydrophenyl)acetyl-CoA isomerase